MCEVSESGGVDGEDGGGEGDQELEQVQEEVREDVYDQGIDILNNLFENEEYDGFPIKPVKVKCVSERIQIDGIEMNNETFSDIENVKKFYNSKPKKETIKKDPELKKLHAESILIQKHTDRRLHGIFIRKCKESLGDKVCDYCKKNPPRASEEFWKDLPRRVRGGLFYSPVEDEEHPGHFKTFLQNLESNHEFEADGTVPGVRRCKVGAADSTPFLYAYYVICFSGEGVSVCVQELGRYRTTYGNHSWRDWSRAEPIWLHLQI